MKRPSRRADVFTRRAKQQNFPARSVFKLEEIDRKFRVFRAGQSVLDLGCAPGSWLMYAAQKVGPQGIVVGVDLHSLKVPLPANSRYLKLDALGLEAADLLDLHPRPFDVVLSDMAPHTSGSRFVDQQRSLRLFRRALVLSTQLSRPGASFLGKIFNSEDLTEMRRLAEGWYEEVRLVKPQASRKQSYEIYLLCRRRRAILSPAPDETSEHQDDTAAPAGSEEPTSPLSGNDDSGGVTHH